MRHTSYHLQSGEQLILQAKKGLLFYLVWLIIALLWLAPGLFVGWAMVHTFNFIKAAALQSPDQLDHIAFYVVFYIGGPLSWFLWIRWLVVILFNLSMADLALTNRRLLGRLFNSKSTAFITIDIPIEQITAISTVLTGFGVQTAENKQSYASPFLSLNERLVRQVREMNSLVSEQG